MVDHNKKALSRIYFQYKNAPKLIEYILSIPDIANSSLEDQIIKIKAILDIDSSEGEQLDICGRIAGYRRRPVGRLYPDCVYKEVSDVLYRKLIKSKIFKNNTIATIDEIKNAADYILGIETTVLDGQNMNMRLVWNEDDIDIVTQQLVVDYDLIPRPQGVGALDHRVLSYVPFGFGEYNQNFNNSTFWWGDGIHINFYASIAMIFDNDSATLTGTVITNDGVLVSDADVLLSYIDSKGNEFYSRVVTDKNGVFKDVIKDTGNYTVTAKTQVLSPLCKMMDVEQVFTFTYRISVKSITPSVSDLEITADEVKYFTVSVLPLNADNRGFTVVSSNENIAKVEVKDNVVSVIGGLVGLATITIIADDNGMKSTVSISVISSTKFAVRIDSVTRPLFFVTIGEDFTVDYGDGVDSRDYTVVPDDNNRYGWVYTTRSLTTGADYTITVKRSDTLIFYSPSGTITPPQPAFNTLKEIIRVSGNRASMGSFARDASGLYKIHDGAFDYLVNVTDFANAFYNCTSLVALPNGLFDHCTVVKTFLSAFRGCTSLKSLPDGLFSKCTLVTTFQEAFLQCTSLTSLPVGLFTGLKYVTTYQYAFYLCTSLTGVPQNTFSGNSSAVSFFGTFMSCSALKTISSTIFKGCSSVTSFYSTFSGCTALAALPEGLFADCVKASNFEQTFYTCKAITSIPLNLFKNAVPENFKQTFCNCISLTEVPAGLFEGLSRATSFYQTFYSCTSVKTVGNSVFKGCSSATDFSYTFYYCLALTSVGDDIFSGCVAVTTFAYTFNNCTSLQNMPLFTDCNKVTTFNFCFNNCTSLKEITPYAFSGKVLANSFDRVFSQCTSLTAIPAGVFKGCTSVTSLQYAFSSCNNVTSLSGDMFEGCTRTTNIQYLFDGCTKIASLPPTLFNSFVSSISLTMRIFGSCSSLTEIPAGFFDKCVGMTSLNYAFLSCNGLRVLPEKLFKYNVKLTSVTGIFYGCDIRSVPVDTFSTCTLIAYFDYLFYGNLNLNGMPEGLFSNNANAVSFAYAFYETAIESVPAGLFMNNTKSTTFSNVFCLCYKLKNVGSGLFNNTSATTLNRAFSACSALASNIDLIFNLPTYTKVTDTQFMFYSCKLITGHGLTFISAVPNVTGFNGQWTFSQATSLNDYNQIPPIWRGNS